MIRGDRSPAMRSGIPAPVGPAGSPRRAGKRAQVDPGLPTLGDRLVSRRARLSNVSWALCFIGFLLYVYVTTTFQLLIAEVGLGMAFIGLVLQRESLRFPPLLGFFAAMLAWAVVSMLGSRWPHLVREELIELGKLGLIILAAANALRSRSQLRFFIIFWLGCFALYPLRGTYFNYFLGGYKDMGRAVWNYTYANSNDLAAMALLMLGLAAGVLVAERNRWLRYAALSGVVLLTLLIFLTQSRAGFIGLVVFGLLALVGNRKRFRTLALVVITGIVVFAFSPSSVWERLGGLTKATSVENLEEVDEEGSAAHRFMIWRTAWAIIPDNAVTGVGWAAYPQANAIYSPFVIGGEGLGPMDAHSTYFTVLAEIGVPGFALFMCVVFGTMLSAERTRRRCKADMPKAARQLYFLEISLLGYMVAGIWGTYSQLNFLYLSLVLLYALADACRRDQMALRQYMVQQAPARPGRA